ncbi:hypothetical protein ABT218_23840 [Streptomyces sp. NPDC001455]|uniref:hypothetical protein n=1 Tax=Streptomyces sp. NPDC001455 TaxID=3154518 RepID=UPI00332124D7
MINDRSHGLPLHLGLAVMRFLRTADDRWSPNDCQQAARRAFAALGEQWACAPSRGRTLLAGCLRQGLAVARDFLLGLGSLADAARAYVGDDRRCRLSNHWPGCRAASLGLRASCATAGSSTIAPRVVHTLFGHVLVRIRWWDGPAPRPFGNRALARGR